MNKCSNERSSANETERIVQIHRKTMNGIVVVVVVVVEKDVKRDTNILFCVSTFPLQIRAFVVFFFLFRDLFVEIAARKQQNDGMKYGDRQRKRERGIEIEVKTLRLN